MNRRALLLLLAGALACAGPGPTTPPADPPPTSDVAIGREQVPEDMLDRLAERFLTAYFAAAPVAATALGAHSHDERWPDLSAAASGERLAEIDELRDAAALIPRAALSPDDRLELDTIRNQLELWRFSLEVEQVWTRDPLAYNYLISTGLDELVRRDFAPLDHRARRVAARLEGLPALVDQAIANLSDPAEIRRPQAKVAVEQYAGLRDLVERELPTRTSEASAKVRSEIAAATPAALAALARLEAHVAALIPEAEGAWRLGPEAFSRKLALTLQSELPADELVRLAHDEHARVRAEMFALARELFAAMHGARELSRFDKRGKPPEALIREVLDELAAAHPEPDELRDAAAATLARLARFVDDHDLVPIDDAEVLEVIWTPAHARGVAIAGLAAPPPLDAAEPGLPSFYLVQPIPPNWEPSLVESYLREYNSFMLEILSIHEAIPGHFVQLYWGRREPSTIRKVFDNGAFVEGWAVYTERVMVEAGYASAGPGPHARRPSDIPETVWMVLGDDALRAQAIRLHGLKFYLRTVTNAILDHEIHAGDMSRDEAIALMVERSFQERGEAEGKWIRAQISSTQLSTYFVGATEWFRLRERAEARAAELGEAFDLRTFHAEALAHGAPPVSRLPELMGWE